MQITLDKLQPIRADLLRLDTSWQEWSFAQLVQALREWTIRNPLINQEPRRDQPSRKGRLLQINQHRQKCAYCNANNHSNKITTIDERKKILKENKLCYNCTGKYHSATECRSKISYNNCNQRHHISFCNKKMENMPKFIVIYSVVAVLINGIKCRALLDSAARSSYISSTIAKLLRKPAVRKEIKRIEMNSTTRNIEIYKATIESLSRTFTVEVELSRVERKRLLTLENPQYSNLIKKYQHRKGVVMEDNDQKPELPIHVILGVGEYLKIKTKTMIKVGKQNEPIAERTHLGWAITSLGKDRDVTSMMLTRNSLCDHDQLCRLDVLGIEDSPTGDQMYVHQEFQDQLKRKADGSYETSLLWKRGHPPLHNDKNGSLSRLNNLIRKLQKQPKEFEQYNQIIQTQLSDGIIEKAPREVKGTEFYIPINQL